MTWREFKERVESEMEKQGITHDVEIWYINIYEKNEELRYEFNLDIHKFAIQNWRNC